MTHIGKSTMGSFSKARSFHDAACAARRFDLPCFRPQIQLSNSRISRSSFPVECFGVSGWKTSCHCANGKPGEPGSLDEEHQARITAVRPAAVDVIEAPPCRYSDPE